MTPLEMAGLYAALAEDGRWRPLRVVAARDEDGGRGAPTPHGPRECGGAAVR